MSTRKKNWMNEWIESKMKRTKYMLERNEQDSGKKKKKINNRRCGKCFIYHSLPLQFIIYSHTFSSSTFALFCMFQRAIFCHAYSCCVQIFAIMHNFVSFCSRRFSSFLFLLPERNEQTHLASDTQIGPLASYRSLENWTINWKEKDHIERG